ncbi:MAG: delta-lactam-biosynthetic de-N-acetylase [Ruminococcaceae bacterium]|nr:delta-lactam-biosynthetic de-N-acetylase [Oscillospiraceae bacterium]
MKRKSIKNLICTISLMLALISALSPSSVYADVGKSYNWYCKNNDKHEVPALDSEFSFINKYGGFYADLNVGNNDKVIYLTFDAGYENGNIEKILDTLKAHNAHGAFFVLENLIVRNSELVLRMKNEGHLVCNHTAKHPDMTKICDKNLFANQLSRLEKAYFELTGEEMAKIYRPPEGRFSEQNLKFAHELGYKTVFWSFAYADWDNNKQMSGDAALKKILDHTHNGEIMLLHPTSQTNAEILDSLLTELEKEGFRFGCLSELWSK